MSEGTSFAQTGKKKKGDKPKTTDKDPKEFDKEYWKDKECYRCGRKGHLATACSVKPLKNEDNDDKSKSGSKASKEFQAKVKKAGAALTQLGEDFDDDLFEVQSHAQLGIVEEVSIGYSFPNPNPNPSQYHINYYLTTNRQCTLCATKTLLLTYASLLTR